MLSHSVAAALRDAISQGEYQPGQQLSEVKVSARFECSRNTLREAFIRLTAERLVDHIPNRGVFIASPDRNYIQDLFRARAALEPSGALWGEFPAAGGLVELAESARPCAAAGQHQQVSDINQRFHRALVASLGSPTLNEQMDNLLARMRLTFLLVIPRYPLLHADHIDGNAQLARLIARGSRREAADLSHATLRATCSKILSVL